MSILEPARMRMWIEMWKEEVIASIPAVKLQQKYQKNRINKEQKVKRQSEIIHAEAKRGGDLL